MKLIAWLLLCILCLMLSMTVIGIVIAVPLFIVGTLGIALSGIKLS